MGIYCFLGSTGYLTRFILRFNHFYLISVYYAFHIKVICLSLLIFISEHTKKLFVAKKYKLWFNLNWYIVCCTIHWLIYQTNVYISGCGRQITTKSRWSHIYYDLARLLNEVEIYCSASMRNAAIRRVVLWRNRKSVDECIKWLERVIWVFSQSKLRCTIQVYVGVTVTKAKGNQINK